MNESNRPYANYARDTLYQTSAPKRNASDMQFGTAFFWYQILVTNTTCSVFEAVYGTSFLVRVFGADLWYVCHGHNWSNYECHCGQ